MGRLGDSSTTGRASRTAEGRAGSVCRGRTGHDGQSFQDGRGQGEVRVQRENRRGQEDRSAATCRRLLVTEMPWGDLAGWQVAVKL